MTARSFPAPWTVVDIPGGHRVQDANECVLGYFYSWDDAAAGHLSGVLTREEARRMADTFARVPEFLSPL